MDQAKERPKIGVSVIVMKDNQVLLGKRKSGAGIGTWGFPGGHLEYAEGIEECARREVMEETGMEITNLRVGPYTNDIFTTEQKHYITLFIISDHKQGEPQLCEPDKCEGWEWFAWDKLPEPLFLPIENLLKQHFKL